METVHVVAINPYRKGNKGKVFSYNIDTYDKVIGSKEIKKMIQQIRGELPIDGVDLNDAQAMKKAQERLKSELPFFCPHYGMFKNNVRRQENAMPESFLFQTIIDVDDKEYVEKAIEKARELNCSPSCTLAYWLAGMTPFDALTHSFSTVSIGGFSTHDASIGYFNSSAINFITVIFLWISACNFALHFRAFSTLGRENILNIYTKDPEFRFFMSIQILLIVVCTLVMISHQYFDSSWLDFEQVVFQAVSISTTTGYTTSNFAEWPSFVPMLLIIASFIGGCAGSVGGGLRVARILVLYLQGARELKRFVHPNLVYPIKWGKNVLDERVIGSIWAFFSAYLLVFTICLLSVIACGVEPFDAFNAVLASINNLGPGLGSVSSNMTAMPDSAKWVLTIAMVCGRLEIFTLLALFTPAFWKA